MTQRKTLLDLDHLALFVADDVALRDEILAIFRNQTESWIACLDPATNDNAWHDAAHALKGASRGVGAWALGDLCAEAETLVGARGSLRERTEFLAGLRDTAFLTIEEVRRLRDLGNLGDPGNA